MFAVCLLTGNCAIYDDLENQLSIMFNAESAVVFNSGYHMNIGILPAVTDTNTLILADKLIHTSLIDGIRLSKGKCIRYRNADYEQLEKLVETYSNQFEQIIIVTESIFSMDGDVTDLRGLAGLKQKYPNVLLYIDEAHAIGVRGHLGLGCVEEQGCIAEIDFLVGTFGKAFGSTGGYIVCRRQHWILMKINCPVTTRSNSSHGPWVYGLPLRFCKKNNGSITTSIAINGTHFPIDDEKGISTHIYHATLENLSDTSLLKFQLRMCGTADMLSHFCIKSQNEILTTCVKN